MDTRLAAQRGSGDRVSDPLKFWVSFGYLPPPHISLHPSCCEWHDPKVSAFYANADILYFSY